MSRGRASGDAAPRPPGSTLPHVLIVDDDPPLCDLLRVQLSSRGYTSTSRTTAEAALSAISEGEFDAVVTDMRLPRMDGLEFCRRVTTDRPNLPVLVLTAFGNMDAAVAAIRAGATDFLTKPVEMDRVGEALARVTLSGAAAKAPALGPKPGGVDAILGRSDAIRSLRTLVARAGASDASVLITGESGTGKELVAQALHHESRRASGSFVAFNCAAVPENLLESEFFGHTRGAFTDAKSARTGIFLEADRGTLFLDEICDLSPRLQPKILRALQERKARPLGAHEEVSFDVRLVAATNEDVVSAVEARRFREDLFFRINVIPIEVPPLRHRGDDVVILAQHFAAMFAARDQRAAPTFTDAALDRLRGRSWPGNVRELQNCIEHAIALGGTDSISADDLPESTLTPRGAASRPARSVVRVRPNVAPGELLSLAEVERQHVMSVLEALNGNKRLAARVLGVDRRTLYRKLDTYGAGPRAASIAELGAPDEADLA